MGVETGPNIITSGLVLSYDGANVRSFLGEPTTNYSRNARDFSGTAYASEDEWVSSEPTRLTKVYRSTIPTPIGNGATLIYESGTAGYHHLSRWGGGGESGTHSLSCYVYPVTTDITEFMIGMLGDGGNSVYFNLNTLAISYGGGISNRDAFIETVPGYPGWYRVGANIEGRVGGWVGAIGYSIHTSYTGTAGNKRCYITGAQYELISKPSARFLEAQASRTTTNAVADLTNNAYHSNLLNGTSYSSSNGGSMVFDGSNDYLSGPSISSSFTSNMTAEAWIKVNASSGDWVRIVGSGGNSGNRTFGLWYGTDRRLLWQRYGASDPSIYPGTGTYTLPIGTWQHVVATTSGSSHVLYVNGSSIGTATAAGPWAASGEAVTVGFAGFHTYTNSNIAIINLYNTALSAAEVAQNFNATRARFGV